MHGKKCPYCDGTGEGSDSLRHLRGQRTEEEMAMWLGMSLEGYQRLETIGDGWAEGHRMYREIVAKVVGAARATAPEPSKPPQIVH
jgi:hypothetical protein